jgi:hypothetical protein
MSKCAYSFDINEIGCAALSKNSTGVHNENTAAAVSYSKNGAGTPVSNGSNPINAVIAVDNASLMKLVMRK